MIRQADREVWQSVAVTRQAQQHRGGSATGVRVPQQRVRQQPRDGSAPAGHRGARGTQVTPPPAKSARSPEVERRYQPGGRRTMAEPLQASWDPLSEQARSARGRRRPQRRGLWGFVRGYGWRVYALPVLAVLTALAVLDAREPAALPIGSLASGLSQSPAASSPAAPTTTDPTPLVPNPAANEKYDEAKASAELPAGGPFTEQGAGTWAVVPGSAPQFGAGQVFTYTVEIEDGVQVPGGPDGFARTVDATLNNPKSWIGSGKYAFQRIDSGTPRIRISLTSQLTTRSICGFKIQFDASCWRGGRTVLNAARWERGAVVFQGNVVAYQQYVVNHEVGHALGFGHRPCAESGALAPIMMQQTWGVSNDYLAALGTDNVRADGKVCAPNPWPYPTPG